MEHTLLHHHPRDGGFRPECKRCQLEAAAPELLAALCMAKGLINANTLLDAGNPANIKIEAAIAKATK